jgi:small subunit ribosomal protein S7
MAGRITKSEEQLRPEPRYQSLVLAKFINCIMWDGKKATAQRVVYRALEDIAKRLEKDQDTDKPENELQVFDAAIANVKPVVEVRSTGSSRRPARNAVGPCTSAWPANFGTRPTAKARP